MANMTSLTLSFLAPAPVIVVGGSGVFAIVLPLAVSVAVADMLTDSSQVETGNMTIQQKAIDSYSSSISSSISGINK